MDYNSKYNRFGVLQGGDNFQSRKNQIQSGNLPNIRMGDLTKQPLQKIAGNFNQDIAQTKMKPFFDTNNESFQNFDNNLNKSFEDNEYLKNNVLPILQATKAKMDANTSYVANNPYLQKLFNLEPTQHKAYDYTQFNAPHTLNDFFTGIMQDLTQQRNTRLANEAMYKNAANYLKALDTTSKVSNQGMSEYERLKLDQKEREMQQRRDLEKEKINTMQQANADKLAQQQLLAREKDFNDNYALNYDDFTDKLPNIKDYYKATGELPKINSSWTDKIPFVGGNPTLEYNKNAELSFNDFENRKEIFDEQGNKYYQIGDKIYDALYRRIR